jgi:hypothetical protein
MTRTLPPVPRLLRARSDSDGAPCARCCCGRAASVGRRVAATRASSGMRSPKRRRRRRRSSRGADRLVRTRDPCRVLIRPTSARYLRTSRPHRSVAEPALLQGFPGVFECCVRLSENRGVPGWSPGSPSENPGRVGEARRAPVPSDSYRFRRSSSRRGRCRSAAECRRRPPPRRASPGPAALAAGSVPSRPPRRESGDHPRATRGAVP